MTEVEHRKAVDDRGRSLCRKDRPDIGGRGNDADVAALVDHLNGGLAHDRPEVQRRREYVGNVERFVRPIKEELRQPAYPPRIARAGIEISLLCPELRRDFRRWYVLDQ